LGSFPSGHEFLHVTADELLGIKPQPREASKFEQVTSDPESMHLWKRFQRITLLPERDQRAVIRLINPDFSPAGKWKVGNGI
jgi:hypothetical protein